MCRDIFTLEDTWQKKPKGQLAKKKAAKKR
jgi:hypothetical protein